MNLSESQAINLLDRVTNLTVGFKPVYVKVTGCINCALMLSMFRYWEKASGEQWINKSRFLMAKMSGLTIYQQDKAIQKLIENDFLYVDKVYEYEHPKNIYKINKANLLAAILNAEEKEKELEANQDLGFVYLMHNQRNRYTKIGFTKKDPKFREKTLQSEEPEIVLIGAVPNATMRDEKNLHAIFKDQRARGEWFDLYPEDVNVITEYFNGEDRDKSL